MATHAQIRARIEAIWTDSGFITTVLTGDEEAIAAADLPAVMVYKGKRSSDIYAPGSAQVTRQWDCLLYVAEVKTNQRKDLMAAIDACDVFLEGGAKDIAAYFNARTRLELAGSALAGVAFAGPMGDGGPHAEPFGSDGKEYGAVVFSLPVVVFS